MRYVLIIACCLRLVCVEADVPLSHLIEYDENACVDILEKAETELLWDVFLEGQMTLFSEKEFQWFSQQIFWQQSQRILEIGSGNGAWLSKLAQTFPGRLFQGIEKIEASVAQAQERYAYENLSFRVGDAEVLDPALTGLFDVVIFRLTLQHLDHPIEALKHAARYVVPTGHLLIIDACDQARKSSHSMDAIQEALARVEKIQPQQGYGNRRITLELLESLQLGQSPLREIYQIVFSNIDVNGQENSDCMQLRDEQNRLRWFNHGLLFLTLVHRTYDVVVDLHQGYRELKQFVSDSQGWISPGIHWLVLQKKSVSH